MKVSTPVILLLMVVFSQAVHAQIDTKMDSRAKKYYHSLNISMENGAMLSNDTELGDQIVNSSYYNGFNLQYGWSKNDPEDTYNQSYRHPTLGLGWYAATFHSSEVGYPNALYFFMSMPLTWETNKRWTGSYTGAFGLSYNFNPYDSINNPTNVFLGSYRNCYLHLGFNLNYHFNNKLSAYGSLGFTHFSNGAFKLPNSGINLVPLTIGAKYRFTDKPVEKPTSPLEPFIQHGQVNVILAAGSKNYSVGEPNYLKMTLGVNYLRQISYKYRMGLGMDFFYAAESGLRFSQVDDRSDFSKSVSYAVVGSWEWVVSRTVFVPIGLAWYLHRNPENGERERYYERVGLRFRIKDHFNTGVTIKAHGGVADMFEWTIAYTFHNDQNNYR